jgi:hypothetical protein
VLGGQFPAWFPDEVGDLAVGGQPPQRRVIHVPAQRQAVIFTRQRAMVVDWPWACRGAAFTDLVLFAPSVALQGGPSPPS